MARTLLINPSSFRTYGSNEGGIAFPVVPPLGLNSLAGAVRARGHQPRTLDLSYRPYDPALIRQVLLDFRPDLVAVTATTPLMNQARDISFLVRDALPGARTILGGAPGSALPAGALCESAFDLVAAGEADQVLADLLDDVDPATMPGLWRREDGVPVGPAAPAQLIDDLDLLPMPAWDLYPPEYNKYLTRFIVRHLPMTVVEFSRGCIYGCDFCASKNTMGRGYRKKSPERCADEFRRLAELGYRDVWITDDIFTTDTEWAKAVCEALIRANTGIQWSCQNGIRVDSADPELFALMARAGCYRVYFGFESGSDEVLKAFGKGGRASVANGIRAVDLARKAGLEADGFFMVGLTGETEETLQATVEFAREIPLDTMKCGICVPFPGTPMFRRLHDEGNIKTLDWDSYTVYNKADTIFDHPTLPWETIKRAFRRFYIEALVKNPAYLWRRLRFMFRNHEVLPTIYYSLKFWVMIWGRDKAPPEEHYEYEDQWRPLDLQLDSPLEHLPVQIVRRMGSKRPTGRSIPVESAPVGSEPVEASAAPSREPR